MLNQPHAFPYNRDPLSKISIEIHDYMRGIFLADGAISTNTLANFDITPGYITECSVVGD